MYVDGRPVKVKRVIAPKKIWNAEKRCYDTVMTPTRKIYIKQLYTGFFFWAYEWDCKAYKDHPDVIRIDGNENFHLTHLRKRK